MSNRRKTQTKIQMKEIVKFIKEGLKITSKTKVNERPNYNYHPKTKEELKSIIRELIKNRGNEGDFNDIDTSEITNMSGLFESMDKFNGDISDWDVSNVIDMSQMFKKSNFKKNISKWDVRKVIKMNSIFKTCIIRDEYKPHFH